MTSFLPGSSEVQFEIRIEDKIISLQPFQVLPSYEDLISTLGINDEISVYWRRAEDSEYQHLTRTSMPRAGSSFVLRLTKKTPSASPEGMPLFP